MQHLLFIFTDKLMIFFRNFGIFLIIYFGIYLVYNLEHFGIFYSAKPGNPDQLLFPVLQEQAGDDYKLKTTFECFQQKLKRVTLQVKQKRIKNMRQLTLHDMMKQ